MIKKSSSLGNFLCVMFCRCGEQKIPYRVHLPQCSEVQCAVTILQWIYDLIHKRKKKKKKEKMPAMSFRLALVYLSTITDLNKIYLTIEVMTSGPNYYSLTKMSNLST